MISPSDRITCTKKERTQFFFTFFLPSVKCLKYHLPWWGHCDKACRPILAVPEDFNGAKDVGNTILTLHKKGDAKELKNYRPMSVLSVTYKLFTTVILNRLSATLNFEQPRKQAGFRKSFSTLDRICAINHVIKKCSEYNTPLYMAFLDNEKALDSVLRNPAVIKALCDNRFNKPYTFQRYILRMHGNYKAPSKNTQVSYTEGCLGRGHNIFAIIYSLPGGCVQKA